MSTDASSIKPWIVVVGGFLGAGKTTLILAAARELERLGRRCAVVLNDQGTSLVDTRLADLQGVKSAEVTGGCFCCRLSELVMVAERLRNFEPEVIFAEPVGTCADIVATVLRPFQEYQDSFRIAPFTVLVDPGRAQTLLQKDSDPRLCFLFSKQIEEADLVCFTKADLHPSCPQIFPSGAARPVRQVCSATGQGVLAWLDEVLSGTLGNSDQPLEIDYQQYAQAEAALAWLNLRATFEPKTPTSPAMTLGRFLDSLDQHLTLAGISIVHLKMIVSSLSGFVKAALWESGQEPQVEGTLDASPAAKHDILLNLRAIGEPHTTRRIIEQELARLEGRIVLLELTCFSPAAPKPEKRIAYSAKPEK
jgi:hypothetical protein